MEKKKYGKRKTERKKYKRGGLVFPEDGSFLSQDEIDGARTKFFSKTEFKITVKGGKINF